MSDTMNVTDAAGSSPTDSMGHPLEAPSYRIRKIDGAVPWTWLERGYKDLYRSHFLGCAHGAWYAILGFALTTLLWWHDILYVSLPLAATFTLIGPLAAVGIYQISKDLSEGRRPSFGRSLLAWRANPTQIALIGVALLLLALAWMRIALLMFMLFFSENPPGPEATLMLDALVTDEGVPLLVAGVLVGGALAFVAFAISAVSIPYLLDQPEQHVFQAIFVSIRAIRENLWPMMIWAVLVAVALAAGLVTAYVGLIFTVPIIGHATWHAYKDLVEHIEPAAEPAAAP